MSRQDDIAAKAIRKTTLRCIKEKKNARLAQLKQDYEAEVREINIKYAKDPERLKAKYAAADFAKTEKAKKRAERRIAKEKKIIELQKNERQLSVAEEVGSSIIQGIGAALFIAATAILETIAVSRLQSFVSLTTVFYALYGGAMILMYIFSVLKHALVNIRAKQVFNRLTHVFAYSSLALGYAVYSITKVQGLRGWILFGIVCAIVLVEIIMYSVVGSKYEIVNSVLCAIAAFSGIIVSKNLYMALSTRSFAMLCAAAAFYLIGYILYCLKNIKYMHLISNIFMLGGGVYVFFSMLFI